MAAEASGVTEADIEKAARILAKGKVVAFTGAGVSAESGVPTYRDPGGLWRKYDMKKVSHINSFLKDPVACWRFELELLRLLKTVRPNAGHFALAELEAAGVITGIVTQNVEGLHTQAGSKKVIELHGNETRAVCLRCGKTCAAMDAFRAIGWLDQAGEIIEDALPDVSTILRKEGARADSSSSSSPSPPPILRKAPPAASGSAPADGGEAGAATVGVSAPGAARPQARSRSPTNAPAGAVCEGIAQSPAGGAPAAEPVVELAAASPEVEQSETAPAAELAAPAAEGTASPVKSAALPIAATPLAAAKALADRSATASRSRAPSSSSSSSSSSGACPHGDRAPPAPPGAPTCPACGTGLLKPDAIYFGERLVSSTLREAQRLFRHGEVALIIGSTCRVAPASILPLQLRQKGGKLVDINPQGSRLSPLADVWLKGRSADVLGRLAQAVMRIRRSADADGGGAAEDGK